MSEFPPDFMWGASTAAHQVEGNNTNNNWWAFEHQPDSPVAEPSGDAIDQYHRYEEDFALLASLGQNAHRLSVEWSRIEPAPGVFSYAALDHYTRVLESLHQHELTPFVTLFHFTLPQWFAERGSWLASDALDIFGRFVERVAVKLGDMMPYVGTINEPQIVSSLGYLAGIHAPGQRDLEKAIAVNRTLASAHHTAVAAMRAGSGNSRVGTCLQIPYIEPWRANVEVDIAAAARMRTYMVDTHLDDLRAAEDPGDFVGLQYYSRDRVNGTAFGASSDRLEDSEYSQLGWEVYPDGFGHVLREVSDVGLPVIVTENGIATLDDTRRVAYLASHLRELKRAMDEGVEVLGYFHWSAFDNYEWGSFEPRFGLIGIDREDGLRRVVRPSAVVYGEVARSGSLDPLVHALG
jgi:beta-glucosidase